MKELLLFLIILLVFSTTKSYASIKLTHPNGGEKFVIGSDTLITWEGIAPTDTVKLEYSIDNGINWKLISNKATGLQYVWKNVPIPPSNACLVKIKAKAKPDSANFVPPIEWQKTYGGSDVDEAYDIRETYDGGFIACGRTLSNDGDIAVNNGLYDFWILKLNHLGNIEWEKTYGDNFDNEATSIRQTNDKGYIVAGSIITSKNRFALLVLKLDILGNKVWELEYSYGNSFQPTVPKIEQTIDGGYIVGGIHTKIGLSTKCILLKLNSSGQKEWEKIYSKENFNQMYSIRQTSDNGYIAVGITALDITANYYALTAKFDVTGNLEWDKSYGKTGNINYAQSAQQSKDGSYIVCGNTSKNNSYDVLLLNYDRNGNMIWEKSYGGSANENCYSIENTKDGGYVASGNSWSKDGDFKNNNGLNDGLIIKFNKAGELNWYRNLGGSNIDFFGPGQLTSDDGFIMVGSTKSTDIPGCINKGNLDFYVVKLGLDINVDQSDSVFSIIAPTIVSHNIDMKESFIGVPKDSTITDFITNAGSTNVRVDSIYFRGADMKDFSLLSDFPKYTLKPNETKSTKFRFLPSHIGLHTAEIVIITQADTIIRTIQGTGIAKLIVSVKNDSAYAGDVKRLKLVMNNLKPETITSVATKFSAKVRFQKTILTPIKKAERNIVKDSIYMNITGTIGKTAELAQLLCIAGLGNVEETTIDIVEFALLDDNGNKVDFNIETQSGLFKLRGICHEGGTRLISPTGKAQILSIIPNPASDEVEISVNLIEEGATNISVYNTNGTKIKEFNISKEIGQRTINIDARDFGNGLYFIQLQTPTVVENKKLMIIR